MGPKSGSGRTWDPCASGAMVNHFQANFNIQNVLYSFPVVNLVRSRPPRPSLDPKPGVGGPKQGLERIYSLKRETRQKFYKTKVVGKVCFCGGGSYFWAQNPDPEGPGPHVLLEPWSIIFRQLLIYKMCSTPSQ